jgi:hypothetical protein
MTTFNRLHWTRSCEGGRHFGRSTTLSSVHYRRTQSFLLAYVQHLPPSFFGSSVLLCHSLSLPLMYGEQNKFALCLLAIVENGQLLR